MRITLPHRFDFGEDRALVGDDLLRPEAWDALRLQTTGPFAIPADLDRAADEQPQIRDRAVAIIAVLRVWGAQKLVSYGAGPAVPERWLARLAPDLELTITEYAPGTVARLAEIWPGVDVRRHDLFDGPLPADAHLFHRIDTDFSDEDWGRIYAAFASQRIVMVATGVLTLRGAWRQRRRLRTMPASATHAGWMRNRGAFEALWSPTHTSRSFVCGDLTAWALEPRS